MTAYHEDIEQLSQKLESERAEGAKAAASSTDDTRHTLAKRFVNFYFGLIIGVSIVVPVYDILVTIIGKPGLVISLKDTLLTISAIIGPTFGLVVAYYFQKKNN